MSDPNTVAWSMRGHVNDERFSVAGSGSADLDLGSTELHLHATPGFPAGFDPALSQLMCNFALAGYAAIPTGHGGFRAAVRETLHVRPRRQVIITDAAGEHIVRLAALTAMTVSGGHITVTNDMTGFSHLPAAVARVYGEEMLVPGTPGAATGVAQYRVELVDGQVLDGLTVVPYRFDRTGARVSVAVRTIADHVCLHRSPTEVTLRAASRWRDLVAASTGVEV